MAAGARGLLAFRKALQVRAPLRYLLLRARDLVFAALELLLEVLLLALNLVDLRSGKGDGTAPSKSTSDAPGKRATIKFPG